MDLVVSVSSTISCRALVMVGQLVFISCKQGSTSIQLTLRGKEMGITPS